MHLKKNCSYVFKVRMTYLSHRNVSSHISQSTQESCATGQYLLLSTFPKIGIERYCEGSTNRYTQSCLFHLPQAREQKITSHCVASVPWDTACTNHTSGGLGGGVFLLEGGQGIGSLGLFWFGFFCPWSFVLFCFLHIFRQPIKDYKLCNQVFVVFQISIRQY